MCVKKKLPRPAVAPHDVYSLTHCSALHSMECYASIVQHPQQEPQRYAMLSTFAKMQTTLRLNQGLLLCFITRAAFMPVTVGVKTSATWQLNATQST